MTITNDKHWKVDAGALNFPKVGHKAQVTVRMPPIQDQDKLRHDMARFAQ
jgi:hypothetical protein